MMNERRNYPLFGVHGQAFYKILDPAICLLLVTAAQSEGGYER